MTGTPVRSTLPPHFRASPQAPLVSMRNLYLSILLVALTAGCVLLPGIGTAPLWDEDEPKNAACSVAMLDSGNWIVPTFNGDLRVEKPPLVNWIQMVGIRLLGRNEAGVRIGSVCLTIGTCLLTWWLGRLLAGPAVGLLSGIIMASCLWTAVGGRAASAGSSRRWPVGIAADGTFRRIARRTRQSD